MPSATSGQSSSWPMRSSIRSSITLARIAMNANDIGRRSQNRPSRWAPSGSRTSRSRSGTRRGRRCWPTGCRARDQSPSAPTRMNGRLDTTFQKFGMPNSVRWSAKPVVDLAAAGSAERAGTGPAAKSRQGRTGRSAGGREWCGEGSFSLHSTGFRGLRRRFVAIHAIDGPGPRPYVPPALERDCDFGTRRPVLRGRRQPPDSAMRPRASNVFCTGRSMAET